MVQTLQTLYDDPTELKIDLAIYAKLCLEPVQSAESIKQSIYEDCKARKPFVTLEDSRYDESPQALQQDIGDIGQLNLFDESEVNLFEFDAFGVSDDAFDLEGIGDDAFPTEISEEFQPDASFPTMPNGNFVGEMTNTYGSVVEENLSVQDDELETTKTQEMFEKSRNNMPTEFTFDDLPPVVEPEPVVDDDDGWEIDSEDDSDSEENSIQQDEDDEDSYYDEDDEDSNSIADSEPTAVEGISSEDDTSEDDESYYDDDDDFSTGDSEIIQSEPEAEFTASSDNENTEDDDDFYDDDSTDDFSQSDSEITNAVNRGSPQAATDSDDIWSIGDTVEPQPEIPVTQKPVAQQRPVQQVQRPAQAPQRPVAQPQRPVQQVQKPIAQKPVNRPANVPNRASPEDLGIDSSMFLGGGLKQKPKQPVQQKPVQQRPVVQQSVEQPKPQPKPANDGELVVTSAERASVRAFLKGHPNTDISIVAKYFTKKQIEVALKSQGILNKNGKLRIM